MTSARLCLLGLVALLAGSLAVAAPVPKDKKIQGLLNDIQGKWDLTSRQIPGGEFELQPGQTWTFTPTRLNIEDPTSFLSATLKLNDEQYPAMIDLFGTFAVHGIVKLEGQELVISVVGKDAPIPKNFESPAGYLLRFKRSTKEK